MESHSHLNFSMQENNENIFKMSAQPPFSDLLGWGEWTNIAAPSTAPQNLDPLSKTHQGGVTRTDSHRS